VINDNQYPVTSDQKTLTCYKMRFIFSISFILLSVTGISQEILSGLQINPVIMEKARELNTLKSNSAGLDTIPMNLPFFDDFSIGNVFPSTSRWIDRYAYVNTDFPVYPVNIGSVTLDAINDSGKMYPNAVPGPQTFIADYLTSRFIRLDSIFFPIPKKLTSADSVYFSFYYQPQGRGLAPERSDSLILQFLLRPAYDSITPTDTIQIPDQWISVWGTEGMALDTFLINTGRYFLQAILPITDTAKFFKKQFRFRFYNRVSLASSTEPSWQSNCDQWNIDNVYLNWGRSDFDTIYPEIRFIERPPSMLINYESMPYPQYCDDPTNEIKDTLNILISNRDANERSSAYSYSVTNPGGSFSELYEGGNYSIKPFYTNGYVTYPPFAHPPVPFLFPISQADSAIFLMKHIINDNTPGSVLGDTIEAYQKFYNYYAYDDGTPEAGYGLTPAGSKLAYRFKLNKSPDTLRAVQMYFNRTLGNNNQQFFYLCVWNDNAGNPGDTIYSELVYPFFTDSLNKFFTYHLNFPLRLSSTFYIGWIQTTNDNLNLGFDRYNNHQADMLYNVAGTWLNSSYVGSLMIRPIVGKPIPLGIEETAYDVEKLKIYPNPSPGSTIQIRLAGTENTWASNENYTFSITNLFGQVVIRGHFTNSIDISNLNNGLYFFELKSSSGISRSTGKFIVAH